ncbi:glycosyltransferase family 4 protein [Cylindrospermum sp. FACHB-282]|uniref:glycosyltransferase family 4 protein n=1 Tax=Cylindrospermum sp. FACHB-282 TaxID=2692794 RepID=UPI001681C622|nr:glycosyltransferase family 4 protein [Cylindrospermum sp. FACHB-282]MBD2388120.1 glycosyltransferase family 4 protein [Cylindrospermum sp. FACHB-282]
MSDTKKESKSIRIAWVSPTMELGFYIQPVLRHFKQILPDIEIFTSKWPGFVPGCENTFKVNIVGKYRYITFSKNNKGYNRMIQLLPLEIVPQLLRFKPQVIFATGFSLWTLLVILLKPVTKWRVIIIYSGSSPNIDMSDSFLRILMRRFIAQNTDAFVTNSQAGKAYLTNVLKGEEAKVFARPYQIPDKQALLQSTEVNDLDLSNTQHPVFLFIGQTIHRKGIDLLLEACLLLKNQGCNNYTLVVIGDGEQRQELESWIRDNGLEDKVRFEGWVTYGKLGAYFEKADIFIFPTLEDIWGMVVLESMLFGKPVMCSKYAGVSEMIDHQENGYIFDPYNPTEIASFMQSLINNPKDIMSMGNKSQELIAQHTPLAAAQFLNDVQSFALKN